MTSDRQKKAQNPPQFWHFWLGNLLRATVAFTFSTCQLPKMVWSWCVLYILTWKCASRYTFSTSQLPKVVQTGCVLYILTWKCASRHNGAHFVDILLKVLWSWGVLYILTSKCASRHNGVQFSMSHLAKWLCTRRFSEPTFRPSGPQIIGKTRWIATFLPFCAPAFLFFSLFLLSDSSHLCFSICPYCRKFDF